MFAELSNMFPTLVPIALNMYSIFYNISIIAFEQGKKTTNALVDSFDKPVLYFFEGSLIPQISNKIFKENGAKMVYCTSEKSFLDYEKSAPPTHLPYISAVLMENDQVIANLSEWMETVKSNVEVPLPYLVIAWAYSTSATLTYPLKYTLSVFTEDGEEKVLEVS